MLSHPGIVQLNPLLLGNFIFFWSFPLCNVIIAEVVE